MTGSQRSKAAVSPSTSPLSVTLSYRLLWFSLFLWTAAGRLKLARLFLKKLVVVEASGLSIRALVVVPPLLRGKCFWEKMFRLCLFVLFCSMKFCCMTGSFTFWIPSFAPHTLPVRLCKFLDPKLFSLITLHCLRTSWVTSGTTLALLFFFMFNLSVLLPYSQLQSGWVVNSHTWLSSFDLAGVLSLNTSTMFRFSKLLCSLLIISIGFS